MYQRILRPLAILTALTSFGPAQAQVGPTPAEKPPVVLLHGLARSADSMERMSAALESAGYEVCNVSYPSRKHSIEKLAADFVAPAIARCFPRRTLPVNFVTHSMGGIIVRKLAATEAVTGVGRVVMLSPPNRGSEAVDALVGWTLFRSINGPAGTQLGTDAASLPQTLEDADFELGIITGNRSINWILSLMIPGEDDGKVSVKNAQLDGMSDFLIMPVSHPFIMRDPQAIDQTIRFLRQGSFLHAVPTPIPSTSLRAC